MKRRTRTTLGPVGLSLLLFSARLNGSIPPLLLPDSGVAAGRKAGKTDMKHAAVRRELERFFSPFA